jgi:23S rRNA (uracil1939-C5)-methyltransferase
LAKLVVTEEGLLGSYRAHSHDVEDMRGCLVHAPGVERIIDRLRDALADEPRPVDLRYVLVRGSFADGKAVVTLVVRALSSPVPARLLPVLRAMPEVVRVIATENDSEGDSLLVGGQEELLLDRGFPVERVGPIEQWLDAGAFAQVNPGAAARLYERASLLAAPSGRAVLDLYSGSGGLGLTMAAVGARMVTGIERSPEAVEAAARAAERLGYQNRTRFIAAKVNPEAIASVNAEVVVLNPPRGGGRGGHASAGGQGSVPDDLREL